LIDVIEDFAIIRTPTRQHKKGKPDATDHSGAIYDCTLPLPKPPFQVQCFHTTELSSIDKADELPVHNLTARG
jgi:hypothetical protein